MIYVLLVQSCISLFSSNESWNVHPLHSNLRDKRKSFQKNMEWKHKQNFKKRIQYIKWKETKSLVENREEFIFK